MNRRCFSGLSLLFVTIGCSAGERDLARTARVDTLASGRVVVANTGRPLWSSTTAWRLEEDLRIGTATRGGPEAEQFGDIASLASDSRGRIYVLDRMSKDIKVFDPDGTFSHTIGREGRGPGELAVPHAVALGASDTIWVVDDGAVRYSAFAPDGTFLTSHFRRIRGYLAATPGAFLEGGRYVDWVPVFPDGRMGARTLHQPILYAPGFGQADTLPPLEYTSPMLPSGGMPQYYFSGRVVAGVDRGGNIWFANSREYRIYRRNLEGDTTLVFSLPATPAPLLEPDREIVRRDFSHRPALAAEFLEALPETKPIVHGIVPDGAGNLFVFVDIVGEPAGSVLDVFQENGVYLGRMTLPTPVPFSARNHVPVVHATSEHLYVVVKDELDVPYVSRLRIQKGR